MHSNLVDYAWFYGDYSDALNQARAAVLKAEQFGSPFFRALSSRALGLALILNNDHKSALRFLEETLPIVRPGGLGHQFEASHLSTLSWAYLGAGDMAKAEEVAMQAVASAQRSRSRTWEMYAWLALLRLPRERLSEARAREGFDRLLLLLDALGAEGLRPQYLLARSAWARNDAERAELRAQALAAFQRIGAEGHVRRLQAEG
jgi:tetratricopeptide (TPR) repeat protein